jgi:type I restriction enzyme, S subunit
VLRPGNYVGSEEAEDEAEPFSEKMARLSEELGAQFSPSGKLNEAISQVLSSSRFIVPDQPGIPDDWQERRLDEIATFLNGLALQKYPPGDGDSLPVIKIAQLRAGHTKDADRASAEIPPAYIVEDGDLLFSWSGSLEVDIWCGGRGALNQHLFKVTSDEFPKWFCHAWILYHLPNFRAIAADKATTMGHIQRQHLHDAKVLVPPAAELKKLDTYLSPLFDKVVANRYETRTLTRLRDALVPRLLSGEVRTVPQGG